MSFGRRIVLAVATAAFAAALAPGSALAGLDDLTKNLADLDATADEVASTASELTAPLTSAASVPVPSAPSPVAETAAPLTNAVSEQTAPLATAVQQTAAPVTTTIQQTTAPVTTTIQQAVAPVASTVQQTAAPVLTTVQQTVAPLTESLQQTTTALVTTVDQVTAPALQAASQVITPVLETAQQVLAPVLTTAEQIVAPLTAPLVQGHAPSGGTVRGNTTPVRAEGSDGGPTQHAPGVVEPAPAAGPLELSTAGTPAASGAERERATGTPARWPRDYRSPGHAAFGGPAWLGNAALPVLDGASGTHRTTAASPARAPRPSAPNGIFEFSASPAPGASVFVPLFAALAAMFLMAAQGVGRRLRPTLASPRLPILALSLERPG